MPHCLHVAGRRDWRLHWWQTRRSYCLWYVSATAQLLHSGTKPQSRHCTCPASPRRLRNRITCSSAASAVSIGVAQRAREHAAVAAVQLLAQIDHTRSAASPATPSAASLPSAPTTGRMRSGSDSSVYSPRVARSYETTSGVALPSTTDRALQPRQLHRGVARVVARLRILLLVRPLVLFVDDDQPEIRLRREHRRPRADHDVVAPVGDAVPLVEQLAVAQAAVQHGHALEPLAEAPHRLRRQRDLRHQHDRPPPGRDAAIERVEVHLRLAAARDAVQQEALVPARCQRRADRIRRLGLRRQQLRRLAPHDGEVRQRIPLDRIEPSLPRRRYRAASAPSPCRRAAPRAVRRACVRPPLAQVPHDRDRLRRAFRRASARATPRSPPTATSPARCCGLRGRSGQPRRARAARDSRGSPPAGSPPRSRCCA